MSLVPVSTKKLEAIEARIRQRFTVMGRGLLVIALFTAVILLVMYFQRPHLRGSLPVQQVTRRVDVNRADAAELALLPGVGPTLAQRIVEYRQRRGAFRSIEQLQMISGFGPATFTSVKPYVFCGAPAATLPAPATTN